MNNNQKNRRWIFCKRPEGVLTDDCFSWREEKIPEISEGQFLVRNRYLSFDPSMRTWMNTGPNYIAPVNIGDPMRSITLGTVAQSRNPAFPEGALVMGMHAWEDYTLSDGTGFVQLVPNLPGVDPSLFLGVLGPTGYTAYFGVKDIGRPAPSATVLVSGAAGAVGSAAGQIARILGCRVVGLAGDAEKCNWLTDSCRFDAVINYRDVPDLATAIAQQCPEGIDFYFDNVGGKTLDAALMNMNQHGRIACCGSISGYDAGDSPSLPVHHLWMVVIRELRMQGFLVSSYVDRFAEAAADIMGWMAKGHLHVREHRIKGLENAPSTLRMLFDGSNRGKLILDIAG